MELNDLRKLFIHHVKDLYNAENQLEKVHGKIQNIAKDEELGNILRKHGKMINENKGSLEKVAGEMDFNLQGEKCYAMEGIIKENREFLDKNTSESVQDAGLIAEAHRVVHYFIAGYGTISRWAEQMELSEEVQDNCKNCISNVEEIDGKLSDIAEMKINQYAMNS